jgi:hypothetical protein
MLKIDTRRPDRRGFAVMAAIVRRDMRRPSTTDRRIVSVVRTGEIVSFVVGRPWALFVIWHRPATAGGRIFPPRAAS